MSDREQSERFRRNVDQFYRLQHQMLQKLHCVEHTVQGITVRTVLDPSLINIIGYPVTETASYVMEFVCTYHFKSQFQTEGRNLNFGFQIHMPPTLGQSVHIRASITEVVAHTVKMKCTMSTIEDNPVLLMTWYQEKNILWG